MEYICEPALGSIQSKLEHHHDLFFLEIYTLLILFTKTHKGISFGSKHDPEYMEVHTYWLTADTLQDSRQSQTRPGLLR